MAAWLCLLTAYHLLLWRRFYLQNPYAYATSEALEQGYASFLHLGRELRAGRFPPRDPYYYADYAGLPFLSSYYPPHLVAAWGATWLSLDQAWCLYQGLMVAHSWLAMGSVFILATAMGTAPLPAGLLSVTLSSLGYTWRQNSSIAYTSCWLAVWWAACLFHAPWWAGISLGLALLGGYWPLVGMGVAGGCVIWLWH